MHDHQHELTARALRALPGYAAPADGWSRVVRRAGRDRRPAGLAWAAAAATAVLVLGVLLRLPGEPLPPPQPAMATAGELDGLRARSDWLEAQLAGLPEPAAQRLGTAYTVALLEDRLALLDDALSEAALEPGPPAYAETLWRERVALMGSLVQVRHAGALAVR
jgi:hypothetical protein